MDKLKLAIITLAVVLTGSLSFAAVPAYAGTPKDDACEALKQINTDGCAKADESINKLTQSIIGILSFIIGIAAVFMVIIGGFKYVTSSGDSSKIANAKTTLIYALVGLFIAALAQFIVQFVLKTAS